jgi:hypothetical protein
MQNLPIEILLLIFEECTPSDKITLSQVCTIFRYSCSWKRALQQYSAVKTPIQDKTNDTFRRLYISEVKGIAVSMNNMLLQRVSERKSHNLYEHINYLRSTWGAAFRFDVTSNSIFYLYYTVYDIYGKLLRVVYIECTPSVVDGKIHGEVVFEDGIPMRIKIINPEGMYHQLKRCIMNKDKKMISAVLEKLGNKKEISHFNCTYFNYSNFEKKIAKKLVEAERGNCLSLDFVDKSYEKSNKFRSYQ